MNQDRTVTAWYPAPGMLSVDPSTAEFTMLEGGTPTPSSRTITVSNVGDRPVSDVSIHNVPAWLSATIDRTVIDTLTPGTMTLSVEPNTLDPGTYTASVYVGDFVMTVATVEVTLTVQSPAPVISGLSVTLQQVNDTVYCANGGSRYTGSFTYSDPDGDVTKAVATIRDHYVFSGGASGTLVWPGAGYYTVGGDGFHGSISVVLCTVFETDTSVTDSFTLEDGAGHVSNALTSTQTKPPGSKTPPPGPSASPANAGMKAPGRNPLQTEQPNPPRR